ncbi:GNAT family N-acetyltransferase [Pediococcus claussenii]|uniref:Acetyltransferase family protein n=1 Tax=Pediococcus claussenii (strain ATCC BAA-344 / DSM 14800 / JCM 18046 / KCTC 3811 / LMG 21948 / P06) TaxID=701521 RepID=G8PF19_PEDCP|nr:GNAT family N-acetyltransferase [Pediococcus claussenii]AEV95698.1 acetyltransferase family protein [Pediococcus claussenii ATCC BAA-344]ANZ69209.1 acetyltransferase [Pediococcus claussenii]ANZ71026.1 acetyltransferase [Pediococcus claussenii]KRN20069.1 hypothetical protein IV79_GL000733 [Pediococcus claussenii]
MDIKKVKGAQGPIYLDAVEVRKQVFTVEQGIDPRLEFDENEDLFSYYVGYEDGKPAVTARTRTQADDELLVQRVATLEEYRQHGLAKKLFEVIEADAKEAGYSRMVLHAQEDAQPFYFAMDYDRFGEAEMEAGIKHYWMMKVL